MTKNMTAEFERVFGETPSSVWSSPGRVNLIGEHTDYNEGYCLPFAIDRRTSIALRARGDRHIRMASDLVDGPAEASLDELRPREVSGWTAYLLGVAWALTDAGGVAEDAPGFDVFVTSTVPIGAGLSSSHSLECAVALALNSLWALDHAKPEIARIVQRAENAFVGAPTGIMDQTASLLGEKDAAVFLDCRTLDAEPIPLGFAEANLAVVVIDTKVSHSHADGGYAARRASCEKGAAVMGVTALRDLTVADLGRAESVLDDETFRRVRHVVTEDQRVLDTARIVRTEGPLAIGDLLDASHVSMRDDFEISVPELDLAVETARAAGAIGARMTGGGFGGAAIALTPRDRIDAVSDAVRAAFTERGFRSPDIFTVQPSGGGREDR